MSRIQDLTMNRGEWSEAYALLSLISNANLTLSDKSLADQNTNQYKVNSILIPADVPNKFVSLSIQNNSVIAHYEGQNNSIPISDVKNIAKRLFEQIQTSTSTTFSFNQLDNLWNAFFNPQIKATSSIKSDIQLEIINSNSQNKTLSGFSIKSNLGGATSLLNASQSTNFLYEAPSLIEAQTTSPKELGRSVKTISLKHHGSVNQIYKKNLYLVDKNLEALISHMLLEYYGASNREKYLKDLLSILANKNPLNLNNRDDYQHIVSKFLRATAFGMVPRKLWDGKLSVSGGMIVVKSDGKLANFYLDDPQSNTNLNEYLLEHCFFDTASTSRHDFGKIFDNRFFKFNLLIRL
jgi:type II restriction enzyme